MPLPTALLLPLAIPLVLLCAGGGLGLLAGLTGTGGGVCHTPLMLLRGWCTTRQAAAVSVSFILLNSMADLAGLAGLLWARHGGDGPAVPNMAWRLLALVLAGVKLLASG